jgi:hypothetical protein
VGSDCEIVFFFFDGDGDGSLVMNVTPKQREVSFFFNVRFTDSLGRAERAW